MYRFLLWRLPQPKIDFLLMHNPWTFATFGSLRTTRPKNQSPVLFRTRSVPRNHLYHLSPIEVKLLMGRMKSQSSTFIIFWNFAMTARLLRHVITTAILTISPLPGRGVRLVLVRSRLSVVHPQMEAHRAVCPVCGDLASSQHWHPGVDERISFCMDCRFSHETVSTEIKFLNKGTIFKHCWPI